MITKDKEYTNKKNPDEKGKKKAEPRKDAGRREKNRSEFAIREYRISTLNNTW